MFATMFRSALPLCPVDGCPQPHALDVWKAINPPTMTLRLPAGKPRPASIDEAVNAHVLERSREVEHLLREHLETHDVLDFVRTIARLDKELRQLDPGVLPAQPGTRGVTTELATIIRRLEQEIGQYESGIRPHIHRDPDRARKLAEQELAARAEQQAR